jgi:hypothetical protein
MDNSSYQNIDSLNENPLNIPNVSSNKTEPETAVKKNLLKDPKIILLFILGSIIVILLLISLIVTTDKKIPATTDQNQVIPTPSLVVSPVVENKIPPQFIEKFNSIDNRLNTKEDFLPPDIDIDFGTK